MAVSQALLLLPQANEQAPLPVQFMTSALHDWLPPHATEQEYSPLHCNTSALHDLLPAQLTTQGMFAGH